MLAAAFFLAGCRSRDTEVFFSNVSAEEIVTVGKPRDLATVRSLRLRIDGRLEGAAQLRLVRDGQPLWVETLSGTVNVDWRGNWTDDRARLHYVPGPGVSGSLRLRYRFDD